MYTSHIETDLCLTTCCVNHPLITLNISGVAGCVADSNKICDLVSDVDMELKHLDRLFLKLRAMSFDAVGIMEMQEELHEYYREKTKSIGIDIC